MQNTSAGNKYVVSFEEGKSRILGCICGTGIKPNTIFQVKNDWCGRDSCVDPQKWNTDGAKSSRKQAKLDYQLQTRDQEKIRPEIQRLEEVDNAFEREANKLSYKRTLTEQRNNDKFHVFDFRYYPKRLDLLLPKFLTEAQPPDASIICTDCQEELSKIKRGDVIVHTPCKHYFHRSCIINSVLSTTGQNCPNCAEEYKIYLFNGFEPTVMSTSLLEGHPDHNIRWLQPYQIISGGYIPNGATDLDGRSRVRLQTSQEVSDKWGEYNDEAQLTQEVDTWAVQQEKRIKEWEVDLKENVEFFVRYLAEVYTKLEAVQDLLNTPFQGNEDLGEARQAILDFNETWMAHNMPLNKLQWDIAPKALSSLRYSENSTIARTVSAARDISNQCDELDDEWRAAREQYGGMLDELQIALRRRVAELQGEVAEAAQLSDSSSDSLDTPSPV